MENMEETTRYTSLSEIRLRKAQLRTELSKDTHRMGELWNGLFHQKKKHSSPTKKFSGWLSTGMGVVDGALLAWKLYRKLGGKRKGRFF